MSTVSGEAGHGSSSSSDTEDDVGTHFGFQQVPSASKKDMVKDVFTSVARNYDVMNDLMSAGMHRLWKDEFVKMLGLSEGFETGAEPPKILDVAGGTGDIAFRMADRLRPYIAGGVGKRDEKNDGSGHLITVSDINPDMLKVGEQRAAEQFATDTASLLRFTQADAEALPFEDNSFHVYTIAFGLRNVTDMDRALREARRVLKPGGRFMCLEFSQVPLKPLQQAYDWYSFNIIPRIGQVVANDRDAYQYLVESIRMFPGQEELGDRMRTAGFKLVSHTNFTAGVVAVHTGFKFDRLDVACRR